MFEPGKQISINGNAVYEYIHTKNQLQVLLCPVPGSNSCAYMRVVRAGSKDEVGVTKSGAAHILEHQSFRIDNGKIWEMARLGDEINASTDLDATKFYIIHQPSQTEEAIKIDAHRFGNHVIPAEAVPIEMHAVKNELERGQRIGSKMFGMTASTAIIQHPYHGQTIGTLSDVVNTTATELDHFRAKFYVPNNATLIFTGNFDPQKTLQHIHRYFGDMPVGLSCNPVHSPEPVQQGLRTIDLNVLSPCPMVCMAFHSPIGNSKESLVLKVISRLTWYNKQGRAKALLDHNILHDVAVYAPRQKDPYLWFLHGTMRVFDSHVQNNMLEMLQTFASVPVSEQRLLTVKRQMRDMWNRATESVSDIMNEIGNGVAIGNWTDIADRHQVLDSITSNDIMQVASTIFRSDNMTVTRVIPTRNIVSLKTITPLVSSHPTAPRVAKLSCKNKAQSWSIIKVAPTTNIICVPQAKYIRASLSAYYPPALKDIASLLTNVSGKKYTTELAALHSDRVFYNESEFIHMAMTFPLSASDIKQAATQMYKYDWLHPVFNEEEVEITKRNMISEMRAQATEQSYYVKSVFIQGLFTGTIYNIPMEQRIRDLTHLTGDHLDRFHQELILNGDNNYITIVAPTLKTAQIVAKQLPVHSVLPVPTMTWISRPRKAAEIQRVCPGVSSFSVMMGQSVPLKGNQSSSIALQCAANILGGGMTSRLMHTVREVMGLGTYGIFCTLKNVNERSDQIFVIQATFSPDSLKEGLACTKQLLRDFCVKGITEKELDFAKECMIGTRQLAADTVDTLQSMVMEEIIKNNDPIKEFAKFEESVKKLTVSQVNFAIHKYIDPETMFSVVYGPEIKK